MSDTATILCFKCRTLPAGNERAGAHSAYCRYCQPWPQSSAPADGDAPAGDGEMTVDDAMAVILRHIAG